MLSPALASDDVERRARSLYNRSRTPTGPPPSRARALELRGWRRGWARLREAQAAQLEISRDRLDAMEAGLSPHLLELGQLLPGVELGVELLPGRGGLPLRTPTVRAAPCSPRLTTSLHPMALRTAALLWPYSPRVAPYYQEFRRASRTACPVLEVYGLTPVLHCRWQATIAAAAAAAAGAGAAASAVRRRP